MRTPAAACERGGPVGAWAAVRRRAAAADGYTLSELVIVLVILVVVLGSLTTLFVSASRAQVDLSLRVEAQQNARLALDSLRSEIHCAASITPTSIAPVPKITITLAAFCPTNRGTVTTASLTIPVSGTYTISVAHTSAFPLVSGRVLVSLGTAGTSACTGKTPTTLTVCSGGASGTYLTGTTAKALANYTWCTRDKAGNAAATAGAGPYSLWRYSGDSCSGTGRKTADHLTTHLVFTAYTAPAGGNLGTLGVSLPVDLRPADGRQRYTLTDEVVLRNSGRS